MTSTNKTGGSSEVVYPSSNPRFLTPTSLSARPAAAAASPSTTCCNAATSPKRGGYSPDRREIQRPIRGSLLRPPDHSEIRTVDRRMTIYTPALTAARLKDATLSSPSATREAPRRLRAPIVFSNLTASGFLFSE